MERCSVCNGRTVSAPEGVKCMNSSCDGSRLQAQEEGVFCRCGEKMSDQGEDGWGQPFFVCIHCGATKRIER
jgi:hypothetical protein